MLYGKPIDGHSPDLRQPTAAKGVPMGRWPLLMIGIVFTLTAVFIGCSSQSDLSGAADPVVSTAVAPTDRAASVVTDAPGRDDVKRAMRSVFDWQLETLGSPEPDWIQSVFMMGAVSAYEATGDTAYLGAATRWSTANDWQLGPRDLHADDHAAGQVYLDLTRLTGDASTSEATLAGLRGLLASDESADRIWWWCDALFMAPPALARAAHVTGDPVFVGSLSGMWWDAADPLFDGDEQLFHRDAAARDNRDGAPPLSRHGNRAFWSRGNGWVLAGIARTLEYLPEDHESREILAAVYAIMAERVIELQGADGLWRTSLLDPPAMYPGETSGTALLCHALAWGVNEGMLDPDAYTPPVFLAWDGLAASVDGDGRLGWVQGVGRRPGLISEAGTAPFGAGAFLLAGSEMLGMLEPADVDERKGAEQHGDTHDTTGGEDGHDSEGTR